VIAALFFVKVSIKPKCWIEIMRKWDLTLLFLVTLVSLSSSGNAQPAKSNPESNPVLSVNSSTKKSDIRLFENISIEPKFQPSPQSLRGISGGTEEMQKYSGKAQTETGACIGFIDAAPDHKVTMRTEFKNLQLKVLSSGDTTLLVRGPGGSWCSDDVVDRNPSMGGQWLAGTYEIWVGSYEANTSYPYLLQITETK